MRYGAEKGTLVERVMGFEPTTLCLGSRYSTTELHPRILATLQLAGELQDRLFPVNQMCRLHPVLFTCLIIHP